MCSKYCSSHLLLPDEILLTPVTSTAVTKVQTNSFTPARFRTFAYRTVCQDHKIFQQRRIFSARVASWRPHRGDDDVVVEVNMTDGIRFKLPAMCCMFLRLSPCLVNKFLSTDLQTNCAREKKKKVSRFLSQVVVGEVALNEHT